MTTETVWVQADPENPFQYKTKELHEQIRIFAPSRASVFSRFKKGNTDTDAPKTSLGVWVKEQEEYLLYLQFL